MSSRVSYVYNNVKTGYSDCVIRFTSVIYPYRYMYEADKRVTAKPTTCNIIKIATTQLVSKSMSLQISSCFFIVREE